MSDLVERLKRPIVFVEDCALGDIANAEREEAAYEIERMRSSAAANVTIDVIEGLAPVQAEGEIYGKPFYFRSRGERWSVSIGEDPIGSPEWRFEHDWPGGEFSASAMTDEEVVACINYAAHRYGAIRTRRRGQWVIR